ncbi:cupin domain-containing protein [Acidocella aromatica]|uniref:Putative cupin superfamily protein n=1 Tax=Acidocella aromatica TaxID=1303579 RepID=A0A840VBH0_9PROT|nr:cupin domain-containing protein [Acidocella aromatica]MBB5372187.1 putative cupin superfamily protein [Acidocella aromatica]
MPKTIAFFPEAAFGPVLNSVDIAHAMAARGHKPFFLSAPMPPEQMAKFREAFINGHIQNFTKSSYEQIDNYAKDCWAAIVSSVKWAQKDLPGAPYLRDPLVLSELTYWGTIPSMIEEESRISGKLIHKGPQGETECGFWVCISGKWECHVTLDEFCHSLEGRATYGHESGKVMTISPDMAAFFPQDWKGVCTVHETVKNFI